MWNLKKKVFWNLRKMVFEWKNLSDGLYSKLCIYSYFLYHNIRFTEIGVLTMFKIINMNMVHKFSLNSGNMWKSSKMPQYTHFNTASLCLIVMATSHFYWYKDWVLFDEKLFTRGSSSFHYVIYILSASFHNNTSILWVWQHVEINLYTCIHQAKAYSKYALLFP